MTNNEMTLLKAKMVQSADKLRNFLNMDFKNAEQFTLLFDHVSAYFRIQTDGFYNSVRMLHCENRSSLKKIDFLENDLKLLKIRLYEFYKIFGQTNLRMSKTQAVREVKLLIKEIYERIKLEKDFLHPLMVSIS